MRMSIQNKARRYHALDTLGLMCIQAYATNPINAIDISRQLTSEQNLTSIIKI